MNDLLQNMDKIHTTPMGIDRIKKNLKLGEIDVVKYCKEFLNDTKTCITRQGKNWYAKKDNIVFTINAYSYTIITAHIGK
ncbi:MAG: DUF3781 domain-containing protein [Anaeroplasmataceae bacterium]|nr:DUF3781 domain-containing protein [Anaeroplasmataceae bacterium]